MNNQESKKVWTKDDFQIVDSKALNTSAVLGYCDGDAFQYHVVIKEDFKDDLKEILEGFMCINSLYSFNNIETSEKRMIDMARLFNTCDSVDANLWVSIKNDDTCYSISVDSHGACLMHEYNTLKSSFDLDLILSHYLHLIKEID